MLGRRHVITNSWYSATDSSWDVAELADRSFSPRVHAPLHRQMATRSAAVANKADRTAYNVRYGIAVRTEPLKMPRLE